MCCVKRKPPQTARWPAWRSAWPRHQLGRHRAQPPSGDTGHKGLMPGVTSLAESSVASSFIEFPQMNARVHCTLPDSRHKYNEHWDIVRATSMLQHMLAAGSTMCCNQLLQASHDGADRNVIVGTYAAVRPRLHHSSHRQLLRFREGALINS